jgi:hypothetical protein
MAEPADLLASWQKALGELAGVTASVVSAPVGLAGQLSGPLQRQAQLVETILERQLAFERELVGRLLAPAGNVLNLVEQTSEALDAQVKAFRTASASFAQIADLLEQQAQALRFAHESVRDPVSALRAAGGELLKNHREPDKED